MDYELYEDFGFDRRERTFIMITIFVIVIKSSCLSWCYSFQESRGIFIYSKL